MTTAAPHTSTLPEPGQLVMVRGSYWVVSDVVPDALQPEVVSLHAPASATLLRLANVGDDALGREIEVFWEREPGARVAERSTMPHVAPGGYDDLGRMSAFLDAIRWGSVASADVASLQAPFRSGVRVEDYQLDPVVRALRTPRANLLIADDVGLGKTIEAGLVCQELLMRQRARRIMIVAPASLTSKWRGEMVEKFGLPFEVVDAEAVKRLRREHGVAANPWRVWPMTIVSIQWLRGERAQRALEEVLQADGQYPRFFDILIVDEAHHLAPAGSGKYAIDTQQTRTVRRLAPHAEHRLFLTATPHNGYRNSFAALLELLDPQRFTRGAEPDPEALAEAMVRRVKEDIRNADGSPRFAQRRTDRIEVDYSDTDRQAHALLSDYVAARSAGGGARRSSATDMVTLLLKKRLFSSPSAFAETVRVHTDTVRAANRLPDAFDDDDETPDWLFEQAEAAEEDYATEEAKNAAEEGLLDAAAAALGRSDARQAEALEAMLVWAGQHGQTPDAKALALLDWLAAVVRPGGQWSDERVVIFTEYRVTQAWLAELLTARGLGGDRLRLIYGGQDEEDRDRVKSAFQAPPDRDPVRILLATDSASEGIDLQRHCHRMVLYDIPFSPNRLEQRIGRLDRYGQARDVEVHHFVGTGWQDAPAGSYENDLEFLSRIAEKVTTIREDLGKVNQLLSVAVEDQMTGRAQRVAVESIDPSPGKSLYRFERQVRDQIETARAELAASREHLRISPGNAEHITATALDLAGQPPLVPHGTMPGAFWVGQRSGVWKAATIGLDDPLTGQERPITFDPEIAAAHYGDVVLAHLNHPLVANATRLLRAEVWGHAAGGTSPLHRVAALRIGDDVSDGQLVVASFARLVVAGADGVRLHEEVFAAGGKLLDDARRWERLTVGRLEGILNDALDRNDGVAEATWPDLVAGEWDRWSQRLATAIDARARERVDSLTRKLEQRRDADIDRITTVLTNLEAQIRQQLAAPAAQQLDMFAVAEERDQYTADRAAWERRLAEIPDEIGREAAAIRDRYATISDYVFPAAVLICVPESLAGGAR